MRKRVGAVLVLLLLVGCSSQAPQPAPSEPPKPKGPEFETGRVAFQKSYIAAHGWARDAQPFRVESQITSDSKGQDGKSAVWRSSFASPSGRSARSYIWSGSNASDAPSRGISPGTEDSYTPTNSSTQVFDIAFLKTDSDQALQTAQKHGGDKILEKSPDTPILYVLDWNHVTNQLVWHVIYGTSRDDAKLRVEVNATTGEFIRIEK
jgi:hypothetical protein